MKCKQCGKEYAPKRASSKYCSARCRKLAFQENGKVSVPEVSVPVQKVSVESMSSADRIGKYIEGYCYGCGRKNTSIKENWVNGIGSEKAGNLIAICLPCVRKGITRGSLNVDIEDSVKIGKCGETLAELKATTDDDLQDNIKMYPQDTWKDSPEFTEVLRRKKKN